jgi:hypothetical protein
MTPADAKILIKSTRSFIGLGMPWGMTNFQRFCGGVLEVRHKCLPAPAFVGVIGDEADMPKKLVDLEALFTDLNKERAELDMAIEEMMADMADLPPERRSTSDWAPDGALTKQFLDMTNRQAELEAEIATVSRAITDAKMPILPH